MILIFKKSQGLLFDAPVQVAAHIRKDGTVVKPHVRIQRVVQKQAYAPGHQHGLFDAPPTAAAVHKQVALFDAPAPAAPAPKPKARASRLDKFIEQKGGVEALTRMLAPMTENQRQQIFAGMVKLDGQRSLEAVSAMFKLPPAPAAEAPAAAPEPEHKPKAPEPVEAKQPAAAAPAPAPEKPSLKEQVRTLKARYAAPPADYKPGDVVDPIDLGKLPYGTVLRVTNDKVADYERTARLDRGDVFFKKVRGEGWQKNPLSPQQRGWFLAGEYGTYALVSLGGSKAAAAAPAPAPAVEASAAAQAPAETAAAAEPAPAGGHRYALTMRPPSIGAVPPGFISHEQDPSVPAARHGVLTYAQPLTDEQVKQYELLPLGTDNAPAELPKLPDAVRRQVEDALSNLTYIAREIREGNSTLADYADDIKELQGKLKIFQGWAQRKNVDADKVLSELGGAPEIRGPREGDTKSIEGVEYVLRGGRWHRAHEDAPAPAPAPAAEKSQFEQEADALYDEHFREHISTASGPVRARFEQRVRLFAESLPPEETKARETLGLMFGGRYGNTPPAQPVMSQAAHDRLQGAFARHLHEREQADSRAGNAVPPALDLPVIEHDGDTWHVLSTGAAREDGKVMAHLSSTTRGTAAANGVHAAQINDWIERDKLGLVQAAAPQMVEHVTGKGKVLRGVIRTDLTADEAKAIDPYTFRKDGGYFIREKHLGAAAPAAASDIESARAVTQGELRDRAQKAAAAAHDRTVPFGVPAGITKGQRREINARVEALVADGQVDKDLMRQYSGNGGCGDSLNEFYTDTGVARAMWDTVVRLLGRDTGTALEPSSGPGVFLHTAAPGFRATAVEMSPISAACAQALHGDRHEVVNSSLERFAVTDDRQFDVVIGNPPYGPRGFLAKDDKTDISTAEAYFVDTALDKCKPGGIVALVVPTGIMDSNSNNWLRHQMLHKAEFLGAQRMPNTAFEHSHTEVTTDVIYLRKRGDDVAQVLHKLANSGGHGDSGTFKSLGVWDDEFLRGEYFTGRGAGNVLGTMTDGWRAKAGMGKDITVEGSMQGVADAIGQFQPDGEGAAAGGLTVAGILETLKHLPAGLLAQLEGAALRRPYENTAKVGDTKTVDGVTYVLQGEPPRWHRVDEVLANEAISAARDLGQRIEALMNGREDEREGLADAVRAYVDKHGIPANNPALMTAAGLDRRIFRLVGAVDRQGELSDLVAGRAPRKLEGGFDAVAQALALGHESGDFDALELAQQLGRERDDVSEQLAADARYAYTGHGRWTTMDAYLTGDLWPKLDAVRQNLESGAAPELHEKWKLQAQRLEEAIGAKSLDDVEVQLNSAFLPLDVVEAYFNWRQFDSEHANDWSKKQQPVRITFADGVYTVAGGNEWGDSKLLGKYLNRAGVRKDDAPDIERWNEEFKTWLCGSAHRERVEDLYNRKFRGFVAPQFSDSPIDVPGLAPDRNVRSWRWSSLRRSLAEGKGIVADDVGLGKTLGGLLLARMAKVDGRSKKPVIVVPKSVLANWYSESQTWFPGSRVLTIGANFSFKDGELQGKDDSASERKRKYHDLQQNDYDFILVSEPAFEEIDLDPVTKENYYSSDFWVQRGEKMGNAGDKRRKKIKEQYEQALAQREFKDHTNAAYFNELGIDMLIADEMHHQKNLYAARARFGEQPKFLGGQGQSNRALDFNLKARWIREQNDGKGIYGLTATPTKNSPLEIYSMLSHVAPEAFERIGVRNSEEFLDRFCEFVNDKVLSTSGDIEDAQVVAGFKNLDELREIMARFIDRRTADDVGLVLPKRDDHLHLVDMTDRQQAVYSELRALAEESKEKDASGDAHIFAIMDKMNKAALDLRLLGSEHAGAASPKYQAIAKQSKAGLKEGAQIIFSEYIDSHERLAAALVDAGIPRDRIGIINAQVAGSAVKRQNIAEALNAGKLDVVIGNATMAEGLNMQKRTTDIHHADVPWEPATLQQRNGRGLRQGNHNAAVRIHTYLSRGSFDGYRWQSVGAKKDWQDLLWNGGDRVDNLAREGKFSRDEMRIMLAADPEAARAAYETDKAAAQQRYDAGQRTQANEAFVKFQSMTRSYGSLKDKNSKTARMLRQRLEASKTALFNNKYFPAKAALDSATDVLVEPHSGTVLQAGQGLDYGSEGKFVVSGVNTAAGTVTMRRYAETGSGRPVTVPLKDLAEGIKPFDFDAKAEAAEVGAKLEAAAAAKLNSISSWDDVKAMPSSVLEANHDLIQQQLKAGTKAYKIHLPYGSVPMVDKQTGKLKMAESYEHTKLHDTHDYLLPTEGAKEKAIEAWIEARRTAKLGTDYVGVGGRSKQTKRVNRREFKGASYGTKSTNPFKHLLSTLSGHSGMGVSPLEKVAKSRMEAQQTERIRRAKTFSEALSAAMPLVKVEGAALPQKALTLLWAKARHLGVLGDKLDAHVERDPSWGGGKYAMHEDYAYGHAKDKSVHAALMSMARNSGHRDLVAAMAASAARHKLEPDAREVAQVLQHGNSSSMLRELHAALERAGILDQTRDAAGFDGGILARPYDRWSRDGSKTLRDTVAAHLDYAQRQEANKAKEAAAA